MLDDDMKAKIQEQAGWFDHGDLIRMIQCITDVETSLAYAVLPILRIEVALARLASMESTVQLKDLFERFGGDALGSPATGVAESAAAPRAARDSKVRSQAVFPARETAQTGDDEPRRLTVKPDIGSITASWSDIVASITAMRPMFGSSLGQAKPLSFENGRLCLSFGSDHAYHCKGVTSNAEEVSALLEPIIGCPVIVVCVTHDSGNDSVAGKDEKKNERDDLIAREPIIKEILDRFGGEINDTWRD